MHRVLVAALLTTVAAPAMAADTVQIWVKAFIPNSHPGNPGYVRKLANAERWVVPAPETYLLTPAARATPEWMRSGLRYLPGVRAVDDLIEDLRATGCYETDNRGFSSDRAAPARLTLDVTLTVDAGSQKVAPTTGTAAYRSGPTRHVDCKTGADLEPPATSDPYAVLTLPNGTAIPPGSGSRLEPARISGSDVIFFVRGRAGNPLTPEKLTPAIDFAGTLRFNPKTRKLRFEGSAGDFPAFEGYASLNGGPARQLFRLVPAKDSTVWSLADLDLGFNSRSFTAEIDLSTGVAAAPVERPVMPTRAAGRSLAVASAFALPATSKLDTAIVAGVIDQSIRQGTAPEATDALVKAVQEVLATQARALADAGLDVALDEAALLSAKIDAVLTVPGVKDGTLGLDLQAAARRLNEPLFAQARTCDVSQSICGTRRAESSKEIVDALAATLIERAAMRVQEGAPQAAALYSRHLTPYVLVDAAADLPTMVAQASNIAGDPAFAAIGEAVRTGTLPIGVELPATVKAVAQQAAVDQLGEAGRVAAASLDILVTDRTFEAADVGAAALGIIGDRAGFDINRASGAVASIEANGLTLANANSGLYLASTLAELFDEKTGRDIQRFGGAALQIAQAFNAYGGSAGMENAAFGIGAAALTGNLLGAGLALAGAFGGGGDGGAEAMAAQIAALSTQIEALGQRMDKRFDRVDAQLGTIYTTMSQNFAQLDAKIVGVQDRVDGLEQSFVLLGGRLDAMEQRLAAGQRDLLTAFSGSTLSFCTYIKAQNPTFQLSDTDANKCLARYFDQATNQASLQLVVGSSSANLDDPTDLAVNLRNDPFQNVAFLAAAAEALGAPLVPPASRKNLVSPSVWAAGALGYRQFADEWPAHYRPVGIWQAWQIAHRGRLLNQFTDAIASPDIGGRLFGALLERYADAANRAELAARTYAPTLFGAPAGAEPTTVKVKPCTDGAFAVPPNVDLEMPVGGRIIPTEAREAARAGLATISVCLAGLSPAPANPPDYSNGTSGDLLTAPSPQPFRLRAVLHATATIHSSPPQTVTLWHAAVVAKTLTPNWHDWYTDAPRAAVLKAVWPEYIEALEDEVAYLDPRGARPASTAHDAVLAAAALLKNGYVDAALATAAAAVAAAEVPTRPVVAGRPVMELRALSAETTAKLAALTAWDRHNKLYTELLRPAQAGAPAALALLDVDNVARMLRAYLHLGLSDEMERNDILRSLVIGDAALVDLDGLAQARSKKLSATGMVDALGTRSLALAKVVAEALNTRARTRWHPGSAKLDYAVSAVDEFRQRQLANCRDGTKPTASCDLTGLPMLP